MRGQVGQKKSPLVTGLMWLALVMAFMAALLGAPSVNELTRELVIEVASRSYSQGVVSFISFLWMLACFPLSFLLAYVALYVTMTLFIMMLSVRR